MIEPLKSTKVVLRVNGQDFFQRDVYLKPGDTLTLDGTDAFGKMREQRDSDTALLRQALEALEACLGWPQVIEALKERLK